MVPSSSIRPEREWDFIRLFEVVTFGERGQAVRTDVSHCNPHPIFAHPDGEDLAEEFDLNWSVLREIVLELDWPPMLEPVECLLICGGVQNG